ncbi:MAG: hypothetical protein ACLVKA_04005 [Collinsella aerofaciens]
MIVAGVPFTYSISAGIGLGFIAYVIVALFRAGPPRSSRYVDRSPCLVYFFVAHQKAAKQRTRRGVASSGSALCLKPGTTRTRVYCFASLDVLLSNGTLPATSCRYGYNRMAYEMGVN